MSADLFAQFGPLSGNNPPSSQSPNQPQDRNSISQPQSQQSRPAEDPFDFFSVALSKTPSQQPQTQNLQSQASQPWPAFGAPVHPAPAATNCGDSAWGVSAVAPTIPAPGEATDDDDAWGDFEDASPQTQESVPIQMAAMPSLQSTYQGPSAQPQSPARTRIVRASTIDLMTNTLINFGDSTPKSIPQQSNPVSAPRPLQYQSWRNPEPSLKAELKLKPKQPPNLDVLFDAEDFDGDESFDQDDDEDDEFGDFETGQASSVQAAVESRYAPTASPSTVSTGLASATAAPGVAGATSLVDLLSLSDLEPGPPAPVRQHGTQPTATKMQPAASLLSPLQFGSTSSPSTAFSSYPQPPKSPSFQERNPFPGLAVTTPRSAEFPEEVERRTPSPVTVWPTLEGVAPPSKVEKMESSQSPKEDWDIWDAADMAGSQHVAKQNKDPKAEPAALEWNWEGEDAKPTSSEGILPSAIANAPAAKTVPDNAPPPTNVPPPSILLSIFLTLITLPDEALFKPTARQPAEIRNRILGDPKTITFLRNYLQLIVVAARVVAGRKQRWHRDKFLSQSMSISAAGSSKGGGMKLTGLDKAQGQREDREAADVVATWLRHVGKLRSAVATANAALVAAEAAEHKHYTPLKIPELHSATIPVTTAKRVPTAPRPCIICGLRRDERVRGIDSDDVQDLFGEWWVEHWGHRACKNFWAEHEVALRSR